MVRSPHQTSQEKDKSSGVPKPPANFMSLFKTITHWWKHRRRVSTTAHVKKDINRLERERVKERTALLKQRKFYERLIRKRTASPKVVRSEPPKVEIPKPEISEIEIPKVELPVKEPEPEIIPEKVEEAPEEHKDIQQAHEHLSTPKAEIQAPPPPVPTSSDIVAPPPAPPKVAKQSFFKKLFKKLNTSVAHGSLAKKLATEREEETVKGKNGVEERSWQAYDGVKANLIKDQGILFFNWHQRLLVFALSIILCCLVISLMYVGLLIWQKERLNDNQATLANFEAINIEISKNEKDIQEVIDFNHKLNLVSFILSNHIYWTNFFTFLEENTLKDVYYESFAGDLTGDYTIPSIARNLDAISSQLEVMEAYNLMRSIQYSGGQNIAETNDQLERVKFNLEISIDPQILLK